MKVQTRFCLLIIALASVFACQQEEIIEPDLPEDPAEGEIEIPNIVYYDFDPDTTLQFTSNVDLNNDGQDDIRFNFDAIEDFNPVGNYSFYIFNWETQSMHDSIQVSPGAQVMGSEYDCLYEGDSVDNTLDWMDEFTISSSNEDTDQDYGIFAQNDNQGFIGLKFVGESDRFGWIQIGFPNQEEIWLKQFAYSTDPEIPIAAGQAE